MLDNPQGSSIEESVTQLQEARKANNPDLESETTGGTDEVVVDTPQDTEVEAVEPQTADAEVDGSSDQVGEGEEIEAPSTYTVKIDGEELEVNLDELRSGYQRDQDYRKKTMALAEERKQVELENSAIAERINKLDALIGQDEESIDWDSLRDSDPSEFIRLQDLQQKRKEALEEEQTKLAGQMQEQHKEMVAQETAKLVEFMGPTWTDEKRLDTFKEANDYLASVDVSVDEANSIVDSRWWKIIFDAKEYQKLKGDTAAIAEEIRTAPKSVKPGQRQKANTQTEVEAAKARLQASDKFSEVDNAVALLKAKRGKK